MQNPLFTNCYFNSLNFYNVFNGTVSNSFISQLYGNSGSTIWNVNFVNTVISNYGNVSNMNFVNCLVGYCQGSNGCVFTNCIMHRHNYNNTLDYTATANNCVFIGDRNDYFNNCVGSNNTIVSSADSIFVNNVIRDSWYFNVADTVSFELTPAAQTQYLGTDGSQVGIYGGMNPYTGLFSYPVINRMQVANKSTDDGQLNVEVEVTPAH